MKFCNSIAILALIGHINAMSLKNWGDDLIENTQTYAEKQDRLKELNVAKDQLEMEKVQEDTQKSLAVAEKMKVLEQEQIKEYTKLNGFAPNQFNIVNTQFVQTRDEDDDRLAEVLAAQRELDQREVVKQTQQKWLETKQQEEKTKEDIFNLQKFTGHNYYAPISITYDVQLKDEQEDQSDKSKKEVAAANEELQFRKDKAAIAQVWADLDKKEQVVKEAEKNYKSHYGFDQSHFTIVKDGLPSSFVQTSESNGYATILDSSDQFDVRTNAEKEDFQKEIQASKKH